MIEREKERERKKDRRREREKGSKILVHKRKTDILAKFSIYEALVPLQKPCYKFIYISNIFINLHF